MLKYDPIVNKFYSFVAPERPANRPSNQRWELLRLAELGAMIAHAPTDGNR
jgi:hypothetical protein